MRGVVVAWTRVVVGEMVMYSGYILKAQPAGFADVLYVECVCETGNREYPRVFDLSNQGMEVPWAEMGKAAGGAGVGLHHLTFHQQSLRVQISPHPC